MVEPATPPTPLDRVRQTLAQLQEPAPLNHLRKLCGMRTAAVCSALTKLSNKGEVVRDARGCQLKLPFPVSPYRPPRERKRETGNTPFAPAEDRALRGRNPSADGSLQTAEKPGGLPSEGRSGPIPSLGAGKKRKIHITPTKPCQKASPPIAQNRMPSITLGLLKHMQIWFLKPYSRASERNMVLKTKISIHIITYPQITCDCF
jgi:hypothetical protein